MKITVNRSEFNSGLDWISKCWGQELFWCIRNPGKIIFSTVNSIHVVKSTFFNDHRSPFSPWHFKSETMNFHLKLGTVLFANGFLLWGCSNLTMNIFCSWINLYTFLEKWNTIHLVRLSGAVPTARRPAASPSSSTPSTSSPGTTGAAAAAARGPEAAAAAPTPAGRWTGSSWRTSGWRSSTTRSETWWGFFRNGYLLSIALIYKRTWK